MSGMLTKDGENFATKSSAIKLDVKEVSEDGDFEGYASTFGNTDRGGDVVLAGAFTNALKANDIKLLRGHNHNDIIGEILELKEDSKGLYIKGRIFTETQLGKETLFLMRKGVLNAMSIGYRIVKARWQDMPEGTPDIYELVELDLHEISVVTFPMNPQATIDGVKVDDLSKHDIERLLRDAGVPNRFAKLLTIFGYDGAKKNLKQHRDDEPRGKQGIADAIAETMKTLEKRP